MTLDEVAKYLSVSRKTIYYWVGRAEIPFVRVGRHLRFDPVVVMRHFSQKTEAEDPATACIKAKAALNSRTGVWSLKNGAGLAGS
jgi:excisionase family DNA binding protein